MPGSGRGARDPSKAADGLWAGLLETHRAVWCRDSALHTPREFNTPVGVRLWYRRRPTRWTLREGPSAGTAVHFAGIGGLTGSSAGVRSSTLPPGGPGRMGTSSGTAWRCTTQVGQWRTRHHGEGTRAGRCSTQQERGHHPRRRHQPHRPGQGMSHRWSTRTTSLTGVTPRASTPGTPTTRSSTEPQQLDHSLPQLRDLSRPWRGNRQPSH